MDRKTSARANPIAVPQRSLPYPGGFEGLILTLLTFLLILGGARFLADGAGALPIPFSTSRPEAFVLDGTMRVLDGAALYAPLESSPTTVHVYNPLSYVTPALLASVVDGGAVALLFAGRLISLMAAVSLSLLLGFWAYSEYRSWLAAASAAALPLFFHEIALTQFFRLRPETAATVACAAAVLCYSRRNEGTFRIGATAIFCLLAFAFKQSFIAAPVAIAIHLARNREWRSLGAFCLFLGGGIALLYGYMTWLTEGAFLENTLFAMASNELFLDQAVETYGRYFLGNAYGLLLALPAAVFIAGKTLGRSGPFLVYWGVALAWNLFSAGKVGSSSNYFAEFGVASVMLVTHGLFVPIRMDATKLDRAWRIFVWVPLLAQALVTVTYDRQGKRPVIYRDDAGVDLTWYMERYASNEGKLILHEKIAIQLGEPKGYDWFLTDMLAEQGRVDVEFIASAIEQGTYEYVVFSQKPYSQLELQYYRAVTGGPYEQSFEDGTIIEFRRHEQPAHRRRDDGG